MKKFITITAKNQVAKQEKMQLIAKFFTRFVRYRTVLQIKDMTCRVGIAVTQDFRHLGDVLLKYRFTAFLAPATASPGTSQEPSI